jgi:AcrR family transcriptional regulator
VPKETFFNLPEDKRAFICDVAIDEFAEYSFDQASINRIVANSGIAKGSFYQYFEDKRDLFFYLMKLLTEEKIKYLSPISGNPDEDDIFTVVRELFLSGIQFAVDHPRYAAIGNKLLANKEATIYRELKVDSLPSAIAIFEPLIEKAIARGEIRADIDIQILKHLITSMNVVIVEYCSEYYPQTIYESMIETADAFIDILKNGIEANNGATL